jgi:hypothetical protein
MLRILLRVLPAVIASALCATASGQTHRLAIVMGNNAGGADQATLKFAETDAEKMARILVELGGIAPSDLILLQGRGLADFRRSLDASSARIAEWRRQPNSQVVFLFYFSGHSDGQSLELGFERLYFRELRDRTAHLGADVRLIIVDSCKSGSLLQEKGGTRAQPFEIHLADLPKSGEVVITSSAADESSLESSEIRGSFFTHHLVSGLRGAADTSRDGRVGLGEAYEYAFTHTTMATANTSRGVQHPSYDYRLSGRGDLVLTELHAHTSSVTLPDGYERILVTQLQPDEVVAELTTGVRTRVALPPGLYGIRVWKGDKLYLARIDLADREDRLIADGDLIESRETPGSVSNKGPSVDAAPVLVADTKDRLTGWGSFAALGLTAGVASGVGQMAAARLGVRASHSRGFELTVDGAFRSSSSFSEYRSMLLVGYRLGFERGPIFASVGARAGAGLIGQRTVNDAQPIALAAGLSPSAGVSWWLGRHVALALETDLLLAVYRRDFALTTSAWPAVLVGVVGAP